MNTNVLVSSENVEFYLLLKHILEVDGFNPALAGSIEETIRLVAEEQPAAIVLDCRSGAFSGADICTQLKQEPSTSSIPIVALVGPGAEYQYVDLLKTDVDESLPGPVAPAKLLDFLRKKLVIGQSVQNYVDGNARYLNYGDIEMNLDAFRVHRNGNKIHLGPIEFKLLRHLLQCPGQVFSRDELIGAVWPDNIYVEVRTVDVHIGRLRKSLKLEGGTDVIRTVRSEGYALNDKAS